jgi:hypothetical protein
MSKEEYIKRGSILHNAKELQRELFGIPLIIKAIENAPTEDVVEVKHGYWFLLDECANEGVYCSVCHKKVYKKDYANQELKSKYCPNCGARMSRKFKKF